MFYNEISFTLLILVAVKLSRPSFVYIIYSERTVIPKLLHQETQESAKTIVCLPIHGQKYLFSFTPGLSAVAYTKSI